MLRLCCGFVAARTSISLPFYRDVAGVAAPEGGKGGIYIITRQGVAYLADAGEAVAPDLVKQNGGFHVAEAVFGDFALAAFGNH